MKTAWVCPAVKTNHRPRTHDTARPQSCPLDEPTTSLDQGTERMALNAIAHWGRNRTMLLVTHRPQVLQIVNRIIVMENGKVVMDGPRDLVLQN